MPAPVRTALNGLGAVLFAFFAWLQHEDDNTEVYVDPSTLDVVLWFGFYALVAVLFVLAILRKFPKWLFVAVAALGLFHLAMTIPGVIENFRGEEFVITKSGMAPDNSKVELSREFFGALIALGATWLVWIQRPRTES